MLAPTVDLAETTKKAFRSETETPSCGRRGIRTPGTVTRTLVFKTSALNRSAIRPIAMLFGPDPCAPENTTCSNPHVVLCVKF